MILKELDPFRGGPAELADRMAADKLAYHLRRHFRRSQDVDVLHGVRVRSGPSMAEMDHLVLHGHGLVAVLRDRHAGRLRVDDEGRWLHGGAQGWEPITSPITHAYVQALLLKSLMDRRVQQRGYFDQIEIDVLVVLDDDCELEGDHVEVLAEVCRREQVGDRIEERRLQCARNARRPAPLSETERRTLAEFIQVVHQPAAAAGPAA